MNDYISQVDLSILNSDLDRINKRLAKLNEEFEELEREREQLQYIRIYIRKIEVNGSQTQTSAPEILQAATTPATVVSSDYGGISDFILKFLEHGEKHTTELINAYAAGAGKEYKDVSNNISNALSRLKTAGKIEGREHPRGRRHGSFLKLKTK